jgi:thiamine kinase-like enzyme
MESYEYMLEEYIPGTPGGLSQLESLPLWKQLGRCAAEFNSLAISGYGEDLDLTTGQFTSSWQETLEKNLTHIFRDDYWETSTAFTASEVAALKQKLAELQHLTGPSGLVHIDIGPKNCIIEPTGRLALIDWEMAEGGITPYTQLASVAGWWGTSSDIYRSFHQGYTDRAGPLPDTTQAVKQLALLNALNSVRWAQDNYPNLVEEYTRSAVYISREA